ncbi:unnamed protein product [Adineta steineri]|uniref:beta-N-acetylhexosaminidase n=1 Tax=Adineta steineri TaxID=433720 RepID=A0A814KDC5_9BILA|nr:unnamed protein product [Adineta steineri]CAF3598557.1 unnamed protein product [Adineta steineri]
MPKFVQVEHSKCLFLSNDFSITSNQKPSKYLELALNRYSKYISSLTGLSIKVHQNLPPSKNTLTIDCSSSNSDEDNYPTLGEDESYILNITETGSYLSGPTLTGLIRGLSTFVQLIERDTSSHKNYIPCVNIVDRPRFPWRGLSLDVSRHWMPVNVVERTLNAMELGKLNVLHLHLSDDQGFRVESIEHNLLHDRKDFFTQKDIRHLVEFAKQRRIRIVPEFDIPGHTTSWFVGYPELATEPRPHQVEIRWGVLKPTMDPTKDSTYEFLDSFFREMTALFPDEYFHIGGDEVEGSQWMQSLAINVFINKHRLGDKNGLQAYFNKRIQKMLRKYNKKLIGWEEILDEFRENLAIDKDAIIQSWKSRKSLASAIEKGYKGLLSTGYYLDHLQPATYHYRIDPILNDELWLFNEEQLSHVLGGEACMWNEYASQDTVDSRLWPRILAIAERFWSPSSINNPDFLYERLFRMSHLLDKMNTGVIHFSSYKLKLEKLLVNTDKKKDLLHPFIILADVCEPYGFEQRSQSNKYTALVPLTTFTDALQPESELVWKLENLPFNDKMFRDIFQRWSLNDIRLRELFDDVEIANSKRLWGQDIGQLSKNLATIGKIGLQVLNYGAKRILHPNKNDSMNSWPISQWIGYHNQMLYQLENQVNEVRLAAVRPVRRLLNSIKIFT